MPMAISGYWYNQQDIWVNYNELTTSSLEIIVSKGNHPQMALIQVSELLLFAQRYGNILLLKDRIFW